ncbi:MAG: Stp1/IreP family PP2C-type Ser/Thr phosphatase [Clostridia bacterium]|nr:Stp1/IreP family PP2C-type Ser/Thr phosphatase [Clostridia bacterium]
MDVGFKTDKGKRRNNNEDAFFVLRNDGVFIVADGVGGNNSGEIASRTAVNEVAQFVEDRSPKELRGKALREYFIKAVRGANFRVYDMAQRYIENSGMATTMVIAYIEGSRLLVCNVGDSRAYVYGGGVLRQITEDHTYVNALVKAGVISKDQAMKHEDKNMITKAIGAENDVEPDIFELELMDGDCVLLCTDGLYGEVKEEDIAGIFAKGGSMTDTCAELVDAANDGGGSDNITVICIKVTEGEAHE